jgi:hypothetical protein
VDGRIIEAQTGLEGLSPSVDEDAKDDRPLAFCECGRNEQTRADVGREDKDGSQCEQNRSAGSRCHDVLIPFLGCRILPWQPLVTVLVVLPLLQAHHGPGRPACVKRCTPFYQGPPAAEERENPAREGETYAGSVGCCKTASPCLSFVSFLCKHRGRAAQGCNRAGAARRIVTEKYHAWRVWAVTAECAGPSATQPRLLPPEPERGCVV